MGQHDVGLSTYSSSVDVDVDESHQSSSFFIVCTLTTYPKIGRQENERDEGNKAPSQRRQVVSRALRRVGRVGRVEVTAQGPLED